VRRQRRLVVVEERAHGEVEEHHARQVVADVTGPEQRVAALLQAKQDARLGVTRERLHLLEAQTAAALALEETPQQPMREQELANDVDQANRSGSHRGSIPSRRRHPYTAPAHDPGAPMHQLDFWSMIFVFMLATFVGIDVIRNVSRLLHTPLMSLTNAISAIAVVGSIIIAGEQKTTFSLVLGTIAVAASVTNIVSGFLITDRMLKMFRQEGGNR